MMNEKKIIIITVIIIILVLCTILITIHNNTNYSDNYNLSKNNMSENVSNDTIGNNSKIIPKTELVKKSNLNSDSITKFSNRNLNKNFQINNGSQLNANNSVGRISEVTSEDIKKVVERGVVWRNENDEIYLKEDVNIGEPFKYTDTQWLVPAFNKNTGAFLGAILVYSDTHKEEDGSFSIIYGGGTNSYSVYKDIISGKPIPDNSYVYGAGLNNTIDSNLNNASSDSEVLKINLYSHYDVSSLMEGESEQVLDLNNLSDSSFE